MAPAPLYNSFMDVFRFVQSLVDVCTGLNGRILKKLDVDEQLTSHHSILSSKLRFYGSQQSPRLKGNNSNNPSGGPSSSVALSPPPSSTGSTSASDSDSDSIVESNTL